MANVVKWLTQPAVNRSFVGSNPIIRPIFYENQRFDTSYQAFLFILRVRIPQLLKKIYNPFCKYKYTFINPYDKII